MSTFSARGTAGLLAHRTLSSAQSLNLLEVVADLADAHVAASLLSYAPLESTLRCALGDGSEEQRGHGTANEQGAKGPVGHAARSLKWVQREVKAFGGDPYPQI